MRTVRRLADHPFVVLLPLQGLWLFWRLARLPGWGDEEMTRRVCAASGSEALRLLGNDIHPPLYFWIARAWLQLPWTADPIVALRALSVVFALVTGVVVYFRWVAPRGRSVRWWFALLWASSPFLLLYARMARSYTLQMLLGTLVVAAAERLVRAPTAPARRIDATAGSDRPPRQTGAEQPALPARVGSLIAYAIAATTLLYTHYLPGIALIASVAAVLCWRLATERDPRLLIPLLVPPLAIALAYAPWLAELASASERFAGALPYALTPSPLLDRLIGLAYLFVSFSFGETLPVWSIAIVLLAAPVVVGLAIAGSAARPAWLPTIAIAAALAFWAAGRWVSYAFITARLSFAYPFWLLLLAYGIARAPRLGRVGGIAMLTVALAASASYVRLEDFLNKAYVIPVDAIADRIASIGAAPDTVVLVDPHGAQLDAGLRRRLPVMLTPLELREDTAVDARRRALDPGTRTIWIVRSTIDRSRDRWVSGLEAELAAHFDRSDHPYVPFSAVDRLAMRLAGWRERPTHVIDVVELRRRE